MPAAVATHLNDPVTAHMRLDFASLNVNQTDGQALAAIREKPPEGRIIYFYVVDDERRLVGVVPTRRLLLNAPDAAVKDIMVQNVVAIPSSATVLDACEFFMLHRLLAFPVVDTGKRMLGVVDVELYTDELADLDRREDTDDLFQLVGVHYTEAQAASPFGSFKSRFPWLITNIVAGILAAFLTGMYEAELKKVVSLALFIPVVLALAESVSIQSVSLALQVLRGKRPTLDSILKKLRTEVLTGVFLGAACGLVVAAVALVWLGQFQMVVCIFGGIFGGITCAAAFGAAMPNVLRFLDREPHFAAGPIALALTDMATLLIYFSIAKWVFA